jgi:hypothetical protein
VEEEDVVEADESSENGSSADAESPFDEEENDTSGVLGNVSVHAVS